MEPVTCQVEISPEDILSEVSLTDVVKYYKDENALDDLIDAIGKEAFLEHFDIKEQES